ncbi:MAG: ADP-ribosylglycohydrolase family protein [bacterium]
MNLHTPETPAPLTSAPDQLRTFPEPPWLPGGATPDQLLEWELHAAREDGRDPAAIDAIEQEAASLSGGDLLPLYRKVIDLPVDPSFAYDEPYELEAIRALRPNAGQRRHDVPTDDAFLYERLYGAWLGRCVSCTLGGPGESFRPVTRERQKQFLQAISTDEWPIRDYLPLHSPSELTFRGIKTDATRGNVRYAPQDDDLAHTVVCQLALRSLDNPREFETQDIARCWYQYLAYRLTEGGCAMMAFRNLTLRYPMRRLGRCPRGTDPIDWHWGATHSNPFRENIDASLRADQYGYAAPGDCELAADLAWRDGRASNVKNGLYCSMFYAAMIAAAFVKDDPEAIIEAGLAEIPSTCRLYEAAHKTIEISKKHMHDDADTLHDAIYTAFGDCDKSIINNMALVVSALLVGGHDFEKVVTYAVMGGWDCDCTGASAGSIAGTMLGASRLPEKWIGPLNDTMQGGAVGYDPIPISQCARHSVAIAQRVLGSERVNKAQRSAESVEI